ncbi:hypothetical protein B1202_02930 [Acinetobacter amyesii]|uniref:Uncharacterized protein n=1 Tax=Acinetobacter amyesii TaxID=2942470 RepID=A0A1T1H6Y7_9GAMM|nr:hypothetical protein B1202_02930 [Acinetobacter amyesii]
MLMDFNTKTLSLICLMLIGYNLFLIKKENRNDKKKLQPKNWPAQIAHGIEAPAVSTLHHVHSGLL